MEEKSVFDEFDNNFNTKRRRNLLPIWIKVFIWLFFAFGFIGILILAFGFFMGKFNLSLYGLETDKVYSLMGFFLTALFILKGIVSYGLWFEQDWGIKIAKIDAIIGLVVCGVSMFILPFFTKNFELRLEVAVLIPYLIKLQKIEKNW
ncbi:hypothetical protein [Chryseobacterium balustinum]|uniref:Uncharacterized protein n=2 Tax=Chryseobacterium balustinum TaxID=246 RepID=A0AAX2INL3_9FLAO|nr:hypothetical protein [Chryseobacterium balustinum]SKB62148.1 hypothetical protein SAMN05421800_104177 [Chryseobacterium balustinum]SQA91261.1 Uncharacterised protein [Chryseobacterium balustinum]